MDNKLNDILELRTIANSLGCPITLKCALDMWNALNKKEVNKMYNDRQGGVNMDKFWMCYVEGSAGCRFIHYDYTSAFKEAERLARLPANVGKKVHITESHTFCIAEAIPVTWYHQYV